MALVVIKITSKNSFIWRVKIKIPPKTIRESIKGLAVTSFSIEIIIPPKVVWDSAKGSVVVHSRAGLDVSWETLKWISKSENTLNV